MKLPRIRLVEPLLFLKTFWLSILSYPVLLLIFSDAYISLQEGFDWSVLRQTETYLKFAFHLIYWTAFNYFIFWRYNEELIRKIKSKK